MTTEQSLEQKVDRLATSVDLMRKARVLEKRTEAGEREKNRRIRILAFITAIGLVLDLVLSVAVIHFYLVQSCRNDTSSAFFTAELDKVEGQDHGLRELRDAAGDQAQAVKGFNDFIAATEAYITKVKQIRGASSDRPFWGC